MAAKKVYLHLEEGAESQHVTVVCMVHADMTVGQAIDYFVEQARRKLPNSRLNAVHLVLNSLDRFKILGGHEDNLYAACDNGEDMLVNTTSKVQRKAAVTPAAPATGAELKKPAATSSSSSSSSASRAVDAEELARNRIEIRKLVSSKSYRRARELCERLLAREFANDAVLQALLIEAYLGAERNDLAVSTAERAVKAHSTEGQLYYLRGKALTAQGNPDEAEMAFRRALELSEKNPRDFPKDFALEASALLAESVYDSGACFF
jgi:tetratricopeptide (TPR) repeat protein